MKNNILATLKSTGISFVEEDLGTTDYYLNSQYRDTNIPVGDGYALNIKIGEARGEVSLIFETFSNALLQESKKELLLNKKLLHEMNANGDLRISVGGKVYSTQDLMNIVDLPDGELKVFYESTMVDLRKPKLVDLLFEELAEVCSLLIYSILPYEEAQSGEVEGRKVEILASKYERSRKNRALCIAHYGNHCFTCGFSFLDTYGEVASDFIHVHHIDPISNSGEKKIDPIKDLVPLCPNCHAVAHLKSPPFLPHEIKKMLEESNGSV